MKHRIKVTFPNKMVRYVGRDEGGLHTFIVRENALSWTDEKDPEIQLVIDEAQKMFSKGTEVVLESSED